MFFNFKNISLLSFKQVRLVFINLNPNSSLVMGNEKEREVVQ
jgi:hypothetical protein